MPKNYEKTSMTVCKLTGKNPAERSFCAAVGHWLMLVLSGDVVINTQGIILHLLSVITGKNQSGSTNPVPR